MNNLALYAGLLAVGFAGGVSLWIPSRVRLAKLLSADEFGHFDFCTKVEIALGRLAVMREYNFKKRQKILTLEAELAAIAVRRDPKTGRLVKRAA